MTTFEIIMVVLSSLALIISMISVIVSLLIAFYNK